MIGIYSRGSRSVAAPFGVGGLDLAFGTSGLRVAYSLRGVTSKKSSSLGEQPYDMKIAMLMIGFWVNL